MKKLLYTILIVLLCASQSWGFQLIAAKNTGGGATGCTTKPATTATLIASSLSAGLTAAYLINEGSGLVLHDSVNSYDATMPGVVGAWIDGSDPDTGFDFERDLNPYAPGSSFTRAAGDGFSVIAKVKSESDTGFIQMIAGTRLGSSAGDLWFFGIDTNEKAIFQYDPTGSGGSVVGVSTLNITGTAAYTLAGVYGTDAVTGTKDLIIYVNGSDEASVDNKPSAAIDQTSFSIARRSDAASNYFDGEIYYVYLYNRVLSAAEVSSLTTNPYQIWTCN